MPINTDNRGLARSAAGFSSTFFRSHSTSRIPLCLLVMLIILPNAAQCDTQQKPSDPARIAAIVTRLGAPTFRERIQAEADCLQTGPSVLPALLQALKHSDPEVRRRAQLLIERIEVDEIEESILEFLAPGSRSTLPGWSIVTDLVDETPELRSTYADLLRGNVPFVRALKRPELLSPELQRQIQNFSTTSGVTNVNKAVILLLLLIHPEAHYTTELEEGAFRALMHQGAFRGVNETSNGQLLQALVTRWVITPRQEQSMNRFSVASQLQLPESVIPAIELVKQKTNSMRLNEPLVAIARFGGAAEMAVVETLLDDKTELSSQHGPNDETKESSQLRDQALVTLIEMTKQSPTTYGIKEIPRDPSGNIRTVTIPFESEQLREAAFEKWREWSEKELREYREPPMNAEEGIRL